LILTLTLIHPVSNWTHWATLRRHPCLSRAATSASSQVNPIFCRSLLTAPLQFALCRPGPLLYPVTCQYSACCGMRLWSIRKPAKSSFSQYVVHGLLSSSGLYATDTFSVPTLVPAKILRCSPWRRSFVMGSAKSELNIPRLKLTSREIIF